MKRIICLLLLIAGLSQAVQANDTLKYRVDYEVNTLVELTFGVGVVMPGYLNFGINVKKYLPADIRLDAGYNAQLLFGDGEYDPMTYSTELLLKGNYPLISNSKHKNSMYAYKAVKNKYLNIHGGYHLMYPGHNLLLGLNYTSVASEKAVYLRPRPHQRSISLEYFDVGVEALLAVGFMQYENNYYIPAEDDFSRIGINLFTYFYMSNLMLGYFEIGWQNVPFFKLGIGVALGN